MGTIDDGRNEGREEERGETWKQRLGPSSCRFLCRDGPGLCHVSSHIPSLSVHPLSLSVVRLSPLDLGCDCKEQTKSDEV